MARITAEDGVEGRRGGAAAPRPDAQDRGLRPGQGDRGYRRRSSSPARACASRKRLVGCYLFSGPTGVGKTEVAKQLAISMGVELIRFDMSEYMERHTVSRLIGAPPGYVGFDQGGLYRRRRPAPALRAAARRDRRAHPDLFNVLLQIMDHGKLTDHNGKRVDFRNVILVMTTNAGAADLAKQAYGFTRSKREGDDLEAINRMFAPSSATGSTPSSLSRTPSRRRSSPRWWRSSCCSWKPSSATATSPSSCRTTPPNG